MSKKLNLAFCLFKYFPFGGLQGDFLQIANICLDRGHKVHAYTITWNGEKPDGLQVTLVPVSGLSNHGKYKSFGKKVGRIVEQKNYDAVVGFNRIPGLDIYYAADGSYAAKMQNRSPLHRISNRYHTFMSLEKAVYDKNLKTEILLLTEKEQSFYMNFYGTAKERFHILPPGISKKCIPPSNKDEIRAEKRKELNIDLTKKIILMVCTVFKIKGVERAIRALASLPQEVVSETKLLVVGIDKPEKYIRLAKKLNVSEQVRFIGARRDVPHLLMASDLFLHPASIENTGTVIVEALVANIPVITTDICGYSHHVTSADAGRVIPSPFVQDTLNNDLLFLLASIEDEKWQKNAKQYIDKTDVFSRSEKAVDIIEKVLS
ncbi:MAG: glycosyltransferase family 4 protein [Desulfobacteraceae bacterium]|nr:glycosyltransferase family 4 protein [Desulfobacteraceae bacterium]